MTKQDILNLADKYCYCSSKEHKEFLNEYLLDFTNAIINTVLMTAQSEVTKWQPIETVPKDGTWIIACVKGYIPCVVRWCDQYGGAFSHIAEDDYTSEDHHPTMLELTDKWEPTHWMPLPPI